MKELLTRALFYGDEVYIWIGPRLWRIWILLLLAVPVSAEEAPCVSVRIVACHSKRTIRVAQGPVTLCAEVRVQPKDDHRLLSLSWDYAQHKPMSLMGGSIVAAASEPAPGDMDGAMGSPDADPEDGVIGSAEDDLDGAREPILIRPQGFKLESLSGGYYEIAAKVCKDHACKQVCSIGKAHVQVR